MFDLTQIEDYVLKGCSSGSNAVFTFNDIIDARLKKINPSITYIGYSDSGMFPLTVSYETGDINDHLEMKQLFYLVNTEVEYPMTECTKANRQDPSLCFHVEYMLPHIKAPLYIIHPGYDTWGLDNVLDIPSCVTYGNQD